MHHSRLWIVEIYCGLGTPGTGLRLKTWTLEINVVKKINSQLIQKFRIKFDIN